MFETTRVITYDFLELLRVHLLFFDIYYFFTVLHNYDSIGKSMDMEDIVGDKNDEQSLVS